MLQRHLKRSSQRSRRGLRVESLERRDLLAAEIAQPFGSVSANTPTLLAVSPNNGELFDLDPYDQAAANVRLRSPTELVLTFGGQHALDVLTLDAISVHYSESGNFSVDASNVPIGFRELDDSGRSVTMRFAENLADGFYQLSITTELQTVFGAPFVPIHPIGVPGDPVLHREVVSFELELGAKVTAVVPQPVDGGVSRANEIDVYFDDLDLFRSGTTVGDPAYYQLIDTQNTVTTEDDLIVHPDHAAFPITVDSADRKVTLRFASPLHSYASGGDSLRLRIGDDTNYTAIDVVEHSVPSTVLTDPGLTLSTANVLPVAGAGNWSTVVVDQEISNETGSVLGPFGTPIPITSMVDNPGGRDEPGHRDIEAIGQGGPDYHLFRGADSDNAITTITYSFLKNQPYGTDSLGQPLYTDLNVEQETRFREVLDLYATQFGIDFYEVTAGQDLALIVGDISTQDPELTSEPGGTTGVGSDSRVTMDSSDFQTAQSNEFGGAFFRTALHEIGHAIGLGHTYDLPPGTIGGQSIQYPDTDRLGPGTEWAFPGNADIIHGVHLHQKEAQDVDLYRVDIAEAGVLKAQTFAERLPDSSLLDTSLTLYRSDGSALDLVSANEDYFGRDSYIEFAVQPGVYVVGVASAGNTNFDANAGRPAEGGTSEGAYELRVDFVSETSAAIRDGAGSLLDGDRDGVAGGNYDFWFEPTSSSTIYVDKLGGPGTGSPGTLTHPFTNIPDALAAAEAVVAGGQESVVVRLLANGGADGDVTTADDNVGYEIGFVQALNQTLDDGRNLILPGGVHLTIDAGVIMKFLDSRISVGSDDDGNDRSGSSISVQGTPFLPVYFTSFNDRTIGSNHNPLPVIPGAGNWGGIEIRNDVDRLQGRRDAERLGVFQNYINHAEFFYGGGQVSSLSRSIDPIHLSQARAEVSYNLITLSADAALSADPNTFEITTFVEPRFQRSSISTTGFVSDYERRGPSIYGNLLVENATNGMFVRIDTPAGGGLETLQVPARFDDIDIVHVLGENLLIEGAVGGPVEEARIPAPIIGVIAMSGGNLSAGNYAYRYTFVDAYGFESRGSVPQELIGVAENSQINLTDIPNATGKYVAKRLYRSFENGPYRLIAELSKDASDFADDIRVPGSSAPVLDVANTRPLHGRIDGSLIIDPGTIIKSQGARIELGFGATLLAEAIDGDEIVFTSRSDDRFGAGGTFDTNGDARSTGTPADWAGIYAHPTSRLSLDHALVAFAGGETGVNGGTAAFNALQIHQADARITNSVFEANADGTSAAQVDARRDFAPTTAATIMVTAAQPTIVNSAFKNNVGSAISINVNSFIAEFRSDVGRQIGAIDRIELPPGNTGPVVRGNRLEGNEINGLDIRGEVLTTEIVWDDTDIVHVLRDDIEIPDLHTFGGLRLESSSTESLVVKADGAEILATGRALDINDRIGGRLHVIGQPGFPVIMTSLFDSTVGAGFTTRGEAQTQTESSGSAPAAGDWQGLKFDSYSHDRNVAVDTEREGLISGFGDSNASIGRHQELGLLAADERSGDENIRLGFTVHGSIADPLDRDLYSFDGVAGTTVWLDIDRTDPQLDTVLEIIDGDGRVLALSQDARTESAAGQLTYVNTSLLRDGHAAPMQLDHDAPRTAGDEYRDLFTTNDGDSGMRVVLPGSSGTRNTFYVRVRSSNAASSYGTLAGIDASVAAGGISHGGYQLQVRIQEVDEHGGSTVRFADLRYATSAIVAEGLPAHSPIAGELFNPGGAVDLGNFSNTDRGAVSIAGVIDSTPDEYTFNVFRDAVQGDPETDYAQSIVVDVDWADGLTRPNTNAYLYAGDFLIAIGTDSNVVDDQRTPFIPGQGTEPADLLRGSQGVRDPFIGPLELDTFADYRVVISTDQQMPAELAQFTQIDPPNPYARIEPLDSLIRIADDRFDYRPGGGGSDTPVPDVGEGPVALQVAFEDDGSNIIPWQFGDLSLIALREDSHSIRQSAELSIYNPFTGRHDAIIEDFSALDGDATREIQVGTIAQSARGDVLSIRNRGTDTETDEHASTTYTIDSEGVFRIAGSTGIETYRYNSAGNPPNFTNTRADVGYEFESIAYYSEPDVNTRYLYGVANRGDYDADGLTGGNFRGVDVIHDANGNNEIAATSVARSGHNMIFLLDPDTGEAVSRRDQNMPAGFESANPLDPELGDDLPTGNFFPAETPWAGTNIVAQVQIPEQSPATGADTGSVTSLVADTINRPFLYAFTDLGAVWQMQIERSSTGRYSPGDLRGEPVLIVDPTLPNAQAGTDFVSDSNGNALIFDKVTQGPANFFDVNDNIGIADLYFGVTPRAGQIARTSFSLSNSAAAAAGGSFTFGTGTLGLAASPGGNAAGVEGNELTAIALVFDSATSGSSYDAATNTLSIQVTSADGATSVNDLVAAINSGTAFVAIAGSDAGSQQPAATAPSLDTPLSGGRDAGQATIRVSARQNGTQFNGITVTVVESTLPPPDSATAVLDGDGNIVVNVRGTVTYEQIRFAINALADYLARIDSSSGDQDYVVALDDPPPTATFNGGSPAGRRFVAFQLAEGFRVAQPVFEFGAETIPVDESGNGEEFAGLFFGSLDQTLWHVTDTLRSEEGHGFTPLEDRGTVIGGGSLRFGFDPLDDDFNHLSHLDRDGDDGIVSDNSDGNNDLDAVDLQGYQDGTVFQPFEGYNFLGGAHGAVQSNTLDLSSFSANDLPTLYFTYLLDTENANADSSAGTFSDTDLDDVMRDSLRVSVRGPDGRWQLVATNNIDDSIATRVWRDSSGSVHEYDPVGSLGYTDPERQNFVQELFDDDVFRQARIDLGPWAGLEDVQIRFDFSTAGEARPDQSEIHALPGEQIADGHQLILRGEMPDPTIDNQGDTLVDREKSFEFDHGLVVQMPTGAHVAMAGGSVRLTRGDGSTIVELVTASPTAATHVQVTPTDTAAEVADKVQASIGTAVRSPSHPSWIGFASETAVGNYTFDGLDQLIHSTPGVTSGQIPIPIRISMTDIEVRDQIQLALSTEIHYRDGAETLAAFPVVGETNAVRVYDLAITQTAFDRPLTLINGELSGNSNMPGSLFGVYSGADTVSSLLRAGERSRGRGGSNGVYIDDIVIGLADRGESFSNADPTPALIDNPYYQALIRDPATGSTRPVQLEVTEGEYQVEVRLSREYLGTDNRLKDTRVGINERLADGFNIVVESDGSQIVDGDTFELSNGFETLRFEFNDVTISSLITPTTPGNVVVDYVVSDTTGQIAETLRGVINSGSVRSVLGVQATRQSGATIDPNETDPVVVLHGYAATDNLGGSTFASPHLTGVVTGGNVTLGEDNGDHNLRRDQGVFIVESNVISFSSGTAIDIAAGPNAPGNKVPEEGDRPKPGVVQHLATLSGDGLIHGAVVQNNLLISNGDGVRLSGDNSGPFVYSRVLNNTIYGSGDGILIQDRAAPTLLNNVLVSNATGIRALNQGPTVIRGSVYSENTDDVSGVVLGTEAIVDPAGPLFVNPDAVDLDLSSGRPNFYPAADSALIDSSIQSQLDRSSIVAVKASVGIPQSPIRVTERDLAGQLRVNGSTSSGQGSNVNIDRGALDRADSIGPQAQLIVPPDNDAGNVDLDRKDTFLQISNGTFNFFEILITEGAGIGPDASKITPDQILVFENGNQLTHGLSVIISYNSSNRTLRIQSPGGIWRPDAVYEIVLLNARAVSSQGVMIEPVSDLAGNPLQPNRADGQTRFTIVMPRVNLDFGDALPSYGSRFADDGARHAIVNQATPRLGRYIDSEHDTAGFGTDDLSATLVVEGNVGASDDGPFRITGGASPTIELIATPQPFDHLAVTASERTIIFELVEGAGTAAVNRTAVNYPTGATLGEIADRLTEVMRRNFEEQYLQAVVTHIPGSSDLVLHGQDDEDGVNIGVADFGGTLIDGVFLDPLTGNALSFLNPSAPNGSEVVVHTTGGGFLDAWVDFDGDGTFAGIGEQVVTSAPVVDGENRLRLFTPASPAILVGGTGFAQARFRLNSRGNQSPIGLEIDGEVEDYVVFVADAPIPEPADDAFATDEDVELVGASVSANDSLPSLNGLRYVLESTTAHGALDWDPATGTFTYVPDRDFYGDDTFSYRLTGTQVVNGLVVPVRSSQVATVTVMVNPINDMPSVVGRGYTTVEPSDTTPISPLTITQAELLANSLAHRESISSSLVAPYDESEQQLRVIQISVFDADGTLQNVVSAVDPFAPVDGIYEMPTHVDRGDGTFARSGSVTVAVSGSNVESVTYLPADDYNRDSPSAGPSVDQFVFTIADDGVTTLPNGLPAIPQLAPQTASAIAFIQVQPQNDAPIAVDDVVPSAALPTRPQEDTPFVIPSAFLLFNDSAGPLGAVDENAGVNDGPLRVLTNQLPGGQPAFPLTTAAGATVTVNANGDLVYTPAPDYYGPDSFEYGIVDQGVDFAGNPVEASNDNPKSARATVFLTVDPVNDAPSAFDQTFVTLEDQAITIGAAELLVGSTGDATPLQSQPQSEANQLIQISALNVGGTVVNAGNAATGPFTTETNGEVVARFDNAGFLIDVLYTPAENFNADNPLEGGARRLDSFQFTVQDDGLAILPQGGVDVGNPPAEAHATASILVAPRNDVPEPRPDFISRSSKRWNEYFGGPGSPDAAAPVPTEDTALTIPRAFLLGNDANGPAGAGDELDGSNDRALTIQTLAITSTLGGSVRLLPGGDLRYDPPLNVSGLDTFTYTVSDAGVSEDEHGRRLLTPLTATAEVSIVLEAVNDPPRLDQPSPVAMSEDAPPRIVLLSGIAAGGGESQALRVTAASNDPSLLADPTVTYTSANDSGTIVLIPMPDQFGTATVTVTVEDAGSDNDLGTAADNLSVTKTFLVRIDPVNDAPTLDLINNVTVSEDGGPQSIFLTGITAGGGETQSLRLSATSSNPALIGDVVSNYVSGDFQGSLSFTPQQNQFGTATITVVVADDGLDGVARTSDDRNVSQTFTVTVEPVNDPPLLDPLLDRTINEDAGQQNVSLTGISGGRSEFQQVRITARSDNPALISDPAVSYVAFRDTGTLTYAPNPDQFGQATITVTVEDSGDDDDMATSADNLSVEQTFSVTVQPVNDVPTIAPLLDRTIAEDAFQQIVLLSEITAGGGESQPIRITATSRDTTLIPDPVVTYTSPNSFGSLAFQPIADRFGSVTIDVLLEDAGGDGDFASTDDNRSFTESFVITVDPVNDDPTLDPIAVQRIDEDSGGQSVPLFGITAGELEAGPLRVTVASSDENLIADLAIDYDSPSSTGTLSYTPRADQFGSATIAVTVEDGGLDDDLNSRADNRTLRRTVHVIVDPVNDPPTLESVADLVIEEDAAQQTVTLHGITAGVNEASQRIRVSAISDSNSLIPNPFANYVSPDSTGTLVFTPVADGFGVATITVTVEDAGVDDDFATGADNLSVSHTFTVTVNNTEDPPVATDDRLRTNEDTALKFNAADLLVNDRDPDLGPTSSETLSVILPQFLTTDKGATIAFDTETGEIEYDPRSVPDLQSLSVGQVVQDHFTYLLTDADGEIDPPRGTVFIDVTGMNDAPHAVDDFVPEPTTGAFAVIRPLENDFDVDGTLDPNSIVITQTPQFGSLAKQINGQGILELAYIPSATFTGRDSFRYTISDNLGQSSTQATVTVEPNVTPITLADFGGGSGRDSVRIDVLSNDMPVEGSFDLSTLAVKTEPANGQATPQGDGTIVYVPNPDFSGTDTFHYTIADTFGNVSAATSVSVRTVESGLENPLRFGDVDDSGEVTPIDALLVINQLARSGANISVRPDDRGPNYVDVDGSMVVSPIDALLVINHLGRQASSASGESVGSQQLVDRPSRADDGSEVPIDDHLHLPEERGVRPLVVTDVESSDWIDRSLVSLLAEARSKGDEESAGDSHSDLVDLAMEALQ